MFNSLWPHELQHTRLPCPSLSPGVCSNSCPLNQWYHSIILPSVIPLLFLPSIFLSIRVFSNESALNCEETIFFVVSSKKDNILKFSWFLVCPFFYFINHAFVVPLTADQSRITLLVLREELQCPYCQNSHYTGWIQFGSTNSLWTSALKIKCL